MAQQAAGIRARSGAPGDRWRRPLAGADSGLPEYLRDVGGAGAVDQIRAFWHRNSEWYRVDWAERQRKRLRRTIWWGVTTQHLRQGHGAASRAAERALAGAGYRLRDHLSKLRPHHSTIAGDLRAACSRLQQDDLGHVRALSRAVRPGRDHPGPHPRGSDRRAELRCQRARLQGDHAAWEPGAAHPCRCRRHRSANAAWYCDNIALDSPYDYEPFWQRCVELGVAVTQHAGSPRWSDRASISNFTYNHVGHFAESNNAFARGVFLGGVVHRHPRLNFGFMEGGIGWACQQYVDMVAHWEKRRAEGLQLPSTTDVAEMRRLIDRYGDERLKAHADAIMDSLDAFRPECSIGELSGRSTLPTISRHPASRAKQDIQAAYSENFYFGCEADDPATMWAFDPRLGARLRPVFSSDFTHFDVPDFAEVVPEAYELLEHGFVSETDLREFTFANAARLHTRTNASFFEGTAVEHEVARELGLKTAP